MNNCLPKTLLATAALLCATAHVHSQALPDPDRIKSEGAPANEEVVVLSEFSVKETKSNDYVASESVTGTRVATKLRELPFTVNVITGQFMEDFNALEFREQMAYTSGVQGFENGAVGYSVRGIEADVQLRNGFRRIGLVPSETIERSEVIKGAAASIYGPVQPSGAVNYVTKKPKAKPEQRVGFSVGSNGFYRAFGSSTGPLVRNKLFYRVDVAASKTRYEVDFRKMDYKLFASSLLWKISAMTSLSLEYEYYRRNDYGSAGYYARYEVVPDPYFVNVQRTYGRYSGIARDVPNYDPWRFQHRDIHTVTMTLEHRFNTIFSLRSSANWFTRDTERQEVSGRRATLPSYEANKGTARYRPYPEGGATWQTDLLANWKTGAVKHNTLLTFDYQQQTDQREQWDSTTAFISQNPIQLGVPYTAQDFKDYDSGKHGRFYYDYYAIPYKTDGSLYTAIERQDNKLDIYGIFLSERATMFNDRLNFSGGVRYDYVKNRSIEHVDEVELHNNVEAVSYQLGSGLRIVPSAMVYVNVSKSFVPARSAAYDEDHVLFVPPKQTGFTWEFGLKAGFFDDRLSFTVAHFDVNRKNVVRTAYNPLGQQYDSVTGEEASKGWEFDFNWSLTPSLQLLGGYAYIDSEYINCDDTGPAFEGMPTRRTPRNSAGIAAKYTVKTGYFKGLFANVGLKYQSKSPNNAPGRRTLDSKNGDIINLRMPNGKLIYPSLPEGSIIPRNTYLTNDSGDYTTTLRINVDDGRENVWNDSAAVWDVGLGYNWKVSRRYANRIQINIKNALDRIYSYGSLGQGPRRSWTMTYSLTF